MPLPPCSRNPLELAEEYEAIREQLGGHSSRMHEMDMSNAALWQQVEALKKQMSVVEKVEYTQRNVKEEGWER